MSYLYRENAIKVAEDLGTKFKDRVSISKNDLEYIFDNVSEKLGIASPPREIKTNLLHKQIVYELLIYLQISPFLLREDRVKLNDGLKNLYQLLKSEKGKYYWKFRILGSRGFYPRPTIKRGDIYYTHFHLKPILLTKNRYESEEQFNNSSEITIVTRNELKFATAVFCSSIGLDHVHFNSFESLELDGKIMSTIPEELQLVIFMELMEYKRKCYPVTHYGGEFADESPVGYLYGTYNKINDFNLAFDAFSIRDHLLMRTSNHLMKSVMLWMNRTFAEDAIMHTFIGLEGCLHLLQKKWGDSKPQLNLKLLQEKFANTLESEQVFDFIQEAYHKRIKLVHPEPKWGAEWNPFLMAEDFYEYFKISRWLLFYYLTDTIRSEF